MKSSCRKHNLKKKIHRRKRSHQKGKSKKRHYDSSLSPSDDDVSLSHSETDDSRSISTSSDSEDELHGRRRGNRGDSRSRTMRGRSSPSRVEGHQKKRKKSKLKGHSVSESQKRKSLKKRRKRVRSSSRDSSRSCSTCRGCSSSGREERELSRARKREKLKFSDTDTRRYRSQSCSVSCSGCSRNPYSSVERPVNESYPKRLGSVITVGKQLAETERRDSCRDENKAEIIQAYDDCPSRSNDSCDEGKKRECAKAVNVQGDHVNRRQLDGPVDCNASGINSSQKDSVSCDDSKNIVSMDTDGLEIDELELKLRIKALENFTKFQREIYANTRSFVDKKDSCTVLKPTSAEVDLVSKLDTTSTPPDRKSVVAVEVHGGKRNQPAPVISALRRDTSGKGDSVGQFLDHAKAGEIGDHKPVSSATTNKEAADIAKPSPRMPESSSKVLLNKISGRNVPETPEGLHGNKLGMHDSEVKNDGESATKSVAKSSSSCNPGNGNHVLNEQKLEEAKGGSHFEQKTMSVMRGGEMVQVSYKVYIPKKAPALARRQLRR